MRTSAVAAPGTARGGCSREPHRFAARPRRAHLPAFARRRASKCRSWSVEGAEPDPDYAPRSAPGGETRSPARGADPDPATVGRDAATGHPPGAPPGRAEYQSSWGAREASQVASGVDYLVELGRQSENMNTAVGARKGLIDDVFAGTANAKFNLGADSDIASGKLRGFHDFQPRTYNNLVGDFHVPPQFADRVALHLAKNFLSDEANPGVGSGDQKALGTTKVPLILGIWGAKGCGKTFNLELSCKLMGVTPVVMSAGELEAEWAGEPGRLVRRRYRKAAEIIKNSGTPSCLIVHDLDAGAGRFKKTQATVNTQMVMGTLMNLCDEPNRVSDESDDEIHEWREDDIIRRVPIIVTGNDLSVLYAPLLRDGRMEKFYWSPTFEDIVDMVHAMFKEENVDRATVEALVREYESQPLDFFGAIRSRMYDDAVREWAGGFRSTTPDPETGQTLYTPALGQALMDGRGRERPDDEEDPGKYIYWRPDFINHGEGESGVDMSVEAIFAHAADLQREQQLVNDKQLSLEYMRYQKTWDEVMEEGGKEAEAERMRRRKSVDERLAEMDDDMRAANDAAMDAAREALRASQEAQRLEREAYLRANPPPPEPLEPDPEPEDLEPPFDRAWRVAESVSECFHLFKTDGVPVVDVRGARDHDREAVVGSVNVPAVLVTGRPLHWEREPFDGFEEAFAKAFPDVDAEIVVVGSSDATGSPDGAAVALARLAASGRTYRNAIEVPGGYDAWVKRYTPAGKKRTGNAKYTNVVGAPGTICAFSEIITQEDGVFDDPSLMRK